MAKYTTQLNTHYVSVNGKSVTVIESIGPYDNILHREFKTEEEALAYYKAQGGITP